MIKRTTTSARIILIAALLAASCGGTPEPEPARESTPPPAEIPAPPQPDPVQPPTADTTRKTAPVAPKAPVAPAPKIHPERPAYTRTDLQVGTGAEAQKGRNISVHYTGWLYDHTKPDMKGRMFDSSRERGPFNFQLGAGQVIPGWDQGFNGMKIGGRRRLIIPPSLGYGVDGAGGGIIPPNATLLFEMELLEVK